MKKFASLFEKILFKFLCDRAEIVHEKLILNF